MEKLHTIPNFLSEQECSELLTKYQSELELKPGKIVGNISNKRKSSVAFIPNIELIDDRLKNKLKELIKLKGYEVTGLGAYQFTEYKIGEFYDWHIDSDGDEYKNRYCSIVIQLNDAYNGGYLQLKDESGDNTIQLDKGIGTMYIFFSNLLHRVMPVTDGIRYSLVNWVSIKRIENFEKTLI